MASRSPLLRTGRWAGWEKAVTSELTFQVEENLKGLDVLNLPGLEAPMRKPKSRIIYSVYSLAQTDQTQDLSGKGKPERSL